MSVLAMKLETFEIRFDNPRGVFCAGEQVKGNVVVKLRNPMKIRKISLYFEGRSKSHWEVKHGRSKTDYRANETYINELFDLYDAVWGEQDEAVEGCCCSAGNVQARLTINKTGFVPGEPITYTIDIFNKSDSNIDRLVTYTGYSNSIFSSGHPKHHTKVDVYPLLNHPCRIKKNTEEHINRAVCVPALPPSTLEGCGIIDIVYYVELKVNVRWTTISIEREIIIGTIPMHFAAPPSYEESVFGRVEIRDENDDEHTSGQMGWAPSYPVYHYDATRQHFQILPAQPEAPLGAPPAYNQI
nr:hypothetical protein BaRGS_012019 [Batillaria attramentaria]